LKKYPGSHGMGLGCGLSVRRAFVPTTDLR
jgi:hypothetical protein